MIKLRTLASVILAVLLVQTAFAGSNERVNLENKFKQYFSEMSQNVQKAETASEKRDIINEALTRTDKALEKVQTMPEFPKEDAAAIASLRKDLRDKYDELNGLNGFSRVSDQNLNSFANYIQQDIEQADTWVTISLTTILLLIIILILVL